MSIPIPHRELFINGAWVAPAKGGRYPIINPATEEQIGTIPAATAEDVEAAVQAAVNAQKTWGKTTGKQRGVYLRAIAEKVREASGRDALSRRSHHAALRTLFAYVIPIVDQGEQGHARQVRDPGLRQARR